MNSDKLQHGYARFLLTQGRTAGEFAAFKAGVEYAEGISTGIVMESKSEIQRRIERSQEALNRPLKDTVKLIPNCPNCECGIYPGNWCRDCPKHRNNGRAE